LGTCYIISTNGDETEQFYEVGAKVSVKWTKEEIGDTNWRAGWYVGEVQEADPQYDEITVQFVGEPESLYTMCGRGETTDGKPCALRWLFSRSLG